MMDGYLGISISELLQAHAVAFIPRKHLASSELSRGRFIQPKSYGGIKSGMRRNHHQWHTVFPLPFVSETSRNIKYLCEAWGEGG